MEVTFGQYALPVIMTVVLGLIYKVFGQSEAGAGAISDRAKPVIAVGLGMALGVLGLFYAGVESTLKNIVDYVLYGFMAGCSSVGLWELTRATVHPAAGTPVK